TQRLQVLYPGVQIVGSHHGYFRPEENTTILASIKASSPDILLVAMGAPKQDKWLHDNLGKSGAAVGIGVGGTFDILAGSAQRAP
ncbi:MAG TPA: glycosyltransferase, partial [Firmicutes bacterium]|nr:glycosyltransferase [Bacillota bacterium]